MWKTDFSPRFSPSSFFFRSGLGWRRRLRPAALRGRSWPSGGVAYARGPQELRELGHSLICFGFPLAFVFFLPPPTLLLVSNFQLTAGEKESEA